MNSGPFLCINGSPAGTAGNSALLGDRVRALLGKDSVETLVLANAPSVEEQVARLRCARGFVFLTGTYWDSWGSPLQAFFEEMTPWELSEIWLGKPAGAVVTMHSVGGKQVLSRLQGVLSSLGCLIPPCSGMVYSQVGQEALHAGAGSVTSDIWCLEDLEIICHNLQEACASSMGLRAPSWRTWPIERERTETRWVRANV